MGTILEEFTPNETAERVFSSEPKPTTQKPGNGRSGIKPNGGRPRSAQPIEAGAALMQPQKSVHTKSCHLLFILLFRLMMPLRLKGWVLCTHGYPDMYV